MKISITNKSLFRIFRIAIMFQLLIQVNSELYKKLQEVCPEFNFSEKTNIGNTSSSLRLLTK
jgi:hypothetical protein